MKCERQIWPTVMELTVIPRAKRGPPPDLSLSSRDLIDPSTVEGTPPCPASLPAPDPTAQKKKHKQHRVTKTHDRVAEKHHCGRIIDHNKGETLESVSRRNSAVHRWATLERKRSLVRGYIAWDGIPAKTCFILFVCLGCCHT